MAVPVSTCQQIVSLVKGDKDYVAVSFDECLEKGVLLTGTPTIVEVTTTDLTLTQKAVSAGITLTGLTYDKDVYSLTKTNGFIEYVWGANDTITITGGTGATAGSYRVNQRVSDHEITLEDNIGDGADEQTNIAATLNAGLLVLGELVPVSRSVIFFVDTTNAVVGTTYRVRITVSTTANTNAGVKVRDVRIRVIAPGVE